MKTEVWPIIAIDSPFPEGWGAREIVREIQDGHVMVVHRGDGGMWKARALSLTKLQDVRTKDMVEVVWPTAKFEGVTLNSVLEWATLFAEQHGGWKGVNRSPLDGGEDQTRRVE